MGARRPLVAFNAVLDSGDIVVAKAIARAIRELSGGLPAVQAMGVLLASRGLAQVSMNLLDYRRTAPRTVGRQLEAEARKLGVRVREYELVGCASAETFEAWPDTLAPVAGLKPTQLLESSVFASADPLYSRPL